MAQDKVTENVAEDMFLRKAEIVLEPGEKTELRLEDLLAGITSNNLHEGIDLLEPEGKEIF